MIKDFKTYINEGLFDRNQSEFIVIHDKNNDVINIEKITQENYYDVLRNEIKRQGGIDVDLSMYDLTGINTFDHFSAIFGDFDDIERLVLPKGLEKLPNHGTDADYKKTVYGFYGKKKLKEIILPESLKYLSEELFCDCGFEELKIPHNVVELHELTCQSCENLKRVYLPRSLESFWGWTFDDCKNLTDLYYEGTEDEFETLKEMSMSDVSTKYSEDRNASEQMSVIWMNGVKIHYNCKY